ncbi:MAG: VOC family protein [Alphaproteobacteria bacterium]|nr:VOC family protein [Alphaproteobacteria bacterium]
MARQLPGTGETFLDHLGHFVSDMEEAHRALSRLGFTQTPYTVHRTAPTLGAEPVASGTANRCVMFHEGYLEVLSVVDAAQPIGARTQAQLDRYIGVHIVAMSDPDALARRDRLAAAGFHPEAPVNLRRPVPLAEADGHDEGEAMAAFTVCRTPANDMPEGRVQILSHHTEGAVWQPRWLEHENGVIGLRDVVILPVDLEEAIDRYTRFTETAPRRVAEDLIRFPLGRGGVVLSTAARAAALFPGATVPPIPGVVGYGLISDGLAATRSFLAGRGFAISDAGPGLIGLALPSSIGGAWLVAEHERAFPWME